MSPRALGILATGLWLLAAAPSFATVAGDVCPPAADPCIMPRGTTVFVTDLSVLDFGSRTLILPSGNGTRLDIGSGSATIIAGSVILNPSSAIVGAPPCGASPPFPRGGTLTFQIAGDLDVLRDGNSLARIDVSNCSNPGQIRVTAGGTVRVEGVLTAQGTQADGGFGTIEIQAADVIVPGSITAAGGRSAGGGTVFVDATGEVNVSGSVDVSGGDGGDLGITAAGRILTSESGPFSRLDVRATAGSGSGGILDLKAGTDLTLGSPLQAQGEASLELGGDGGAIVMTAGGSIDVTAPINLFGTIPDGIGGDLDVTAELDIVQVGAIDASGKRSFGAGGFVDLLAKRALTAGSISVRGDCDECAGGEMSLEGWCSVSAPAATVLDAGGPFGSIALRSGGTTSVLATATAGNAVTVAYHPSGTAPTLGGSITPTPTVTTDDAITPCGGPGVCDRDGATEEGEECDDGNDVNCDACSNSCKTVVCGNDRLDPCEECDDGNQTNCDGCRSDCSRADAVCGDSVVECGEACDPGSALSCNPEDLCSAECRVEQCGNGVQECEEECDDGSQNGQPGSNCAADCMRLPPPNCGNDVFVPSEGEFCDDGNLLDCDGCNHVCEIEACGNNTTECLEECDDFNTSGCDGCSALCTSEACGNGVTDCGEECDEGEQNGQPGSSCFADTCRLAETCTTESTGTCIPCADALDCDPLGVCGGLACDVGVCTPVTVQCDDTNPCTTDSCSPTTGCAHTLLNGPDVPACDDDEPCTDPVCTLDAGCQQAPKTQFASVDCRLGEIDTLVGGDGLDAKARQALGKLLSAASLKLDVAEEGHLIGRPRKAKSGFRAARQKLGKFVKKVGKLAPARIPDPAVAALLVQRAEDAIARVDALRAELDL